MAIQPTWIAFCWRTRLLAISGSSIPGCDKAKDVSMVGIKKGKLQAAIVLLIRLNMSNSHVA
ncbi:MAG: hypothetical protein NTY15_08750 [Planctomycetota bacterium]|nr:hypothetical protein [Planctomycetota bacterium]